MTEQRKGREGGRWINERPSADEFGKWFAENMRIDPELEVEKYVGGVVLIPALDRKAKVVTGWTEDGAPIVTEQPELSYVPYAKVDTRINYFWDMLDAHDELIGLVAPESLDRLSIDMPATITTVDEEGKSTTTEQPGRPGALSALVYQLPDGFSIMSVPVGEAFNHFLLSTVRVSIYERASLEAALEGADGDMLKAARITLPRRTGRGTKQVPLIRSYNQRVWADESAIMKAETGALGRALGFAGIFVIPGSGVATAEDMQDLAEQTAPVNQPEAASTPDEKPARTPVEASEDEQTELHNRAIELWKTLRERGEDSQSVKEFKDWAKKRSLTGVADAKGATLRGVVRKLEQLNDQANQEGADADTSGEAAPGDADAGADSEGAVRDSAGAEEVEQSG